MEKIKRTLPFTAAILLLLAGCCNPRQSQEAARSGDDSIAATTAQPELKEFRDLDLALKTPDSVRFLILYDEGMTRIPNEVYQLMNLERLHATSSKIGALDKQIGTLANLRILNLEQNQLTSLPDAICKLSKLAELNLMANHITELPACMCKMKSLRKLFLWGNGLDARAEEIRAMLPRCEVIFEGDF